MDVNSATAAPQSVQAAVMVKAREHQKLEGETAQKLIESASSTDKVASSGHVGRNVNTVA